MMPKYIFTKNVLNFFIFFVQNPARGGGLTAAIEGSGVPPPRRVPPPRHAYLHAAEKMTTATMTDW